MPITPISKKSTLPAVRISDKFKEETEQAANIEQENLSEYIRKSVEIRNKKVLKK